MTAPFRRLLLVSSLTLLPIARAAVPKATKPVHQTPWQVAEAARQQLLGISAEQRTREDYSTVMDAYRLIYHGAPGDPHATEAIFDVGLLLAEQGSALHDAKASRDAIGQFEFLRTQYSHSQFRSAALLQEAQIAAGDLRDVKLARTKYVEFVQSYPQSTHFDEAQAALKSLRAGVLPPAAKPQGTAMETATTRGVAASSNGVPGASVSPELHAEASLAASQGMVQQPVPVVSVVPQGSAAPQAPASASSSVPSRQAVPSTTLRSGRENRSSGLRDEGGAVSNDSMQDARSTVPAHTKSGLATVSAIRHWSTPTYTRVAIDLGDEVQYEAARVPGPDRIYFDLHGTRLLQELAGKSFTVTDDGFLKRIRAAQYSNDMTRVVLDVNDVTEYSAFLLPNPYRLIIDIHGGDKAGATTGKAAPTVAVDRGRPAGVSGSEGASKATAGPLGTAPPRGAAAAQPATVAAQKPVTNGAATAVMTAAAVPSTVASRTTTGGEMAALGSLPETERATAEPTSQPIAVATPLPSLSRGKTGRQKVTPTDAAPVHAASPTAAGDRTLQRALGLKIGRIVIDPGHGGHDSGTIGVGGIMEKDVVLDVALRLGRLLHEKLGAEIIYTRSDDTFIPLETRTAIANKAEADLFISVHANSSGDETARGVETYYLNFTSQPDALDVAARENAVSDRSVHQLADLVKKITLKDKLDESREFAADVEQSLYDGLHRGNEGLKNRGVKKAPFVVLIGANMPSILTEISFVTNGKDAAQLRTPDYRERVAQSIFRGVAAYTSGLSGVRVAAAKVPDVKGQ